MAAKAQGPIAVHNGDAIVGIVDTAAILNGLRRNPAP
jgi:hypothetical protein